MQYGEHVDNSVIAAPNPIRTDIAMTLFLSDPASYDGGELVIKMSGGDTRVKFPAGSLAIYPPYYVHRVEPVTRGTRYAAISWAESVLRDPDQRRVLNQLDRTIRRLRAAPEPDAEQVTDLMNIYHTLMRMWV